MHHSSRYCSGDQRSHVCDHWGLSGSNSQGEGGSFNSVATRHGGGCIPRTTKGARSSARGGVQGTLLQNSVPCRGYMGRRKRVESRNPPNSHIPTWSHPVTPNPTRSPHHPTPLLPQPNTTPTPPHPNTTPTPPQPHPNPTPTPPQPHPNPTPIPPQPHPNSTPTPLQPHPLRAGITPGLNTPFTLSQEEFHLRGLPRDSVEKLLLTWLAVMSNPKFKYMEKAKANTSGHAPTGRLRVSTPPTSQGGEPAFSNYKAVKMPTLGLLQSQRTT
jgi:hypothetical protein